MAADAVKLVFEQAEPNKIDGEGGDSEHDRPTPAVVAGEKVDEGDEFEEEPEVGCDGPEDVLGRLSKDVGLRLSLWLWGSAGSRLVGGVVVGGNVLVWDLNLRGCILGRVIVWLLGVSVAELLDKIREHLAIRVELLVESFEREWLDQWSG